MSDNRHHILAAEWTWIGTRFEPNIAVDIDPQGNIAAVGPVDPKRRATRLKNRALLPGFVNAHSHAFQRGLRGKAEKFGRNGGSFWSWREEMYRLAASLDVERFRNLAAARDIAELATFYQ